MDKIPMHRLRRKPKPPALETSVDRDATSNTAHIDGDDAAAPKISKSPGFPSRMSPFRRLRGGKRARSCSPAASLLGEPVAAVVSNSAKSTNEQDEEPSLKIPAFLTQSDLDLQNRFEDIQNKDNRRTNPATDLDDEGTVWSLYQSENGPVKSVMDRYCNIRPWSHNRVKLRVPDGAPDYVNASPIAVPPSEAEAPTLRYIATQGPTVPSIDSVWRMVAENTTSSAVIVQLTTMMEGAQVKCSQYFPFSDEDKTWALNAADAWGDGWAATLTYESTEELCDGAIERRKLLLRVGEEETPRTVWHFLYLRWPDFGTPALTDVPNFFELMRMSREQMGEAEEEPRFVHCSAGVGRTGTFICLEHLMRELDAGAFDAVDPNDADADPVYETVDALRQQRRYMVQSAPQFTFIYQVMRQLWGERYGLCDDEVRGGSDGGGGGDGNGGGGVGGGTGQQPALKRLEMATDPTPPDESASVGSPISDGGVSLGETQD
ncbi:hypothetical protein V2A60_007317 [Cordyceps javanica]